jgi:nitroimidazol reductase NimA-like FMN-containing flavoprotein (pyridoxamine 5'-phosphate oxidase superfamily)
MTMDNAATADRDARPRSYVDDLTDEVCRTLLASHHIGRVAFVGSDGVPTVLPVNYVVDGNDVVLRTDRGLIREHLPSRRVAFEVDDFDTTAETGWSVLMRGRARDVTETLADSYKSGLRRAPHAWAPGDRTQFLAIEIERISGRQIVRHGPPDADTT